MQAVRANYITTGQNGLALSYSYLLSLLDTLALTFSVAMDTDRAEQINRLHAQHEQIQSQSRVNLVLRKKTTLSAPYKFSPKKPSMCTEKKNRAVSCQIAGMKSCLN